MPDIKENIRKHSCDLDKFCILGQLSTLPGGYLTSCPTFFLVYVNSEQEMQQFVTIANTNQWLRMSGVNFAIITFLPDWVWLSNWPTACFKRRSLINSAFSVSVERKFFFSGAAAVRNRCGGGGQRKGKGKTGRFLSPYLLSANGKCNWQYSRTNTICPSSSWPGPRVRLAAGQSLQEHYTCSLGLGCRSCGCKAAASSLLKRLPARNQEKKYWGEKIPSSEEDKRTKYARKRIM